MASPPGPTLTKIIAAFTLAPYQVQTFDPAHPRFDAARELLVLAAQFEAARPLLRARYAPDATVRLLRDGAVEQTAAATLPFDADAWLMPALRPEEDRAALEGLRGVVERLFAPDGCPWDREQTPQTLRRYLLEEAYELIDAIDRDDVGGMREELGDLFAHLFMQTALAQQAGRFTAEDVAAYAHAKFVRRHPHVFGDEEAGSTSELLDRWEAIKRVEREQDGTPNEAPTGALDSVPRAAPALQRLQSLVSRARRAGLRDPGDALARAALEAKDPLALIVAAIHLADAAEMNAEEALRQAAQRFTSAFAVLEAAARVNGTEIAALPVDVHESAWDALTAPIGSAPREAP